MEIEPHCKGCGLCPPPPPLPFEWDSHSVPTEDRFGQFTYVMVMSCSVYCRNLLGFVNRRTIPEPRVYDFSDLEG